jgi:hypothetical protein
MRARSSSRSSSKINTALFVSIYVRALDAAAVAARVLFVLPSNFIFAYLPIFLAQKPHSSGQMAGAVSRNAFCSLYLCVNIINCGMKYEFSGTYDLTIFLAVTLPRAKNKQDARSKDTTLYYNQKQFLFSAPRAKSLSQSAF